VRLNTRRNDLEATARLAARGDRHAFGVLCATIEPDIWRYCRSVMHDHAAAEDATQETFARIVTAIRRYRGDAPVRPWALVIARRVCSEAFRRRQRTDIPVDQQRHAHHHPVTHLHRGHLSSAEQDSLLDELAPDDRAAFVLTQLLGFGYAEAAEIADVPIGTIRSRIHRARDQLALLWVETAGDEVASLSGREKGRA
jgi:RNA polymerase sigma-70 factor (ECF subfamily)